MQSPNLEIGLKMDENGDPLTYVKCEDFPVLVPIVPLTKDKLMEWTSTPPTQEGYYWWRSTKPEEGVTPSIIHIYQCQRDSKIYNEKEGEWKWEGLNGTEGHVREGEHEWFGPLTCPP